jgi:hypothetical protein
VNDKVCLTKDDEFCLEDFEWFMITHQLGISAEFNGVLGLCRNFDPTETEKVGPLLINQLSENDILKHNVFAFYLESSVDQDKGQFSFVDFGNIKNENMSNRDDLVWLPLDDHFFWLNNNCRAIRFGDVALSFNNDESYSVVFDSGTSIILAPGSQFEIMIETLKE